MLKTYGKMNDKWIRIIGYPPIIGLSWWVFHGETLHQGWQAMLHGLIITTVFTVSIWEGNRLIFIWLSRRFSAFAQTPLRITSEVVASVVYSVLIQVLLEWVIFYWLNLHPSGAPPIDWMTCILVSLVPLVPMMAIYEGLYFFEQWKQSIRQQEALALANMQSQLEALKKQLDPHFLFNSLNTLAYLIDLDNDPAQEYLSRLSDVYRYVLETRNRTTVSLVDELTFLEDYLYLNQVRCHHHLHLEKVLPPAVGQQQIPALSLQLLVENALKHNVISAEQPLHIRITAERDGITVSNNKQPRSSLATSTKVGLSNLAEQYRLLTHRPIEIDDTAQTFSVHLPFLERALA
jgi:sensor histidine kinase YesM